MIEVAYETGRTDRATAESHAQAALAPGGIFLSKRMLLELLLLTIEYVLPRWTLERRSKADGDNTMELGITQEHRATWKGDRLCQTSRRCCFFYI